MASQIITRPLIRARNVKLNDAILSVQVLQLREVAEFRWDGARELILKEEPEKSRMNKMRAHCN